MMISCAILSPNVYKSGSVFPAVAVNLAVISPL